MFALVAGSMSFSSTFATALSMRCTSPYRQSFGSGERLFDAVKLPALGYACVRHEATAWATHLIFVSAVTLVTPNPSSQSATAGRPARYPLLPLCAFLLAVGGCASTTTAQLSPSPQEPVCEASAAALILWRPQWRADQKEVPAREAAAADGLGQFFEKSGCFQSASLERLTQTSEETAASIAADATRRNLKVVLITVRELGPTVKIGASMALVEGGTEVVLGVSEFIPGNAARRTFTVQWRSGGPGVVKGIASLPQDMQAALAAGLQPAVR